MKLTPSRVVSGLIAFGMIGIGAAYSATALFGGIGVGRPAQLIRPITPELIQQGLYVARAADCAACHTAPGGRPFAGGLAITTPLGQIYTTNITPDEATGIGKYSYEDFERLIRHGVRPNGETLYPAMPFPSYAKISDTDLQALYSYFKGGVQPVAQLNRSVDIPWPFSMRWPLTYWRWFFSPPSQATQTATSVDPVRDRGAYLVESLGHCGACHTPRGLGLQEKALSDDGGTIYLSGGLVDNYVANNLRGDVLTGLGGWSANEIVEFLKTGRNGKAAAFGGMSDVIEHSTQYMTDADLNAIARYLKSLKPAQQTRYAYDGNLADALASGRVGATGAIDYLNNCAACHLSSGKGYVSTFPALAGNPVVNADDPSSLINIVLRGGTVPATDLAPTHFTMPAFGDRLTDRSISEVVTFIRSSWGNSAPAVTADQVAKLRAAPHAPISPYSRVDPRFSQWLADRDVIRRSVSPLSATGSADQPAASEKISNSRKP